MKFSIKDLFCKCDQIRSKLRIWLDLLEKLLLENLIFCEVESKFKTEWMIVWGMACLITLRYAHLTDVNLILISSAKLRYVVINQVRPWKGLISLEA